MEDLVEDKLSEIVIDFSKLDVKKICNNGIFFFFKSLALPSDYT